MNHLNVGAQKKIVKGPAGWAKKPWSGWGKGSFKNAACIAGTKFILIINFIEVKMTEAKVLKDMELGHFCLDIVSNVVVCTCLVLSACKIFKQKKITDWFPVTIWILVLVTELIGVIDGSYFRFSNKNSNFKNSIGGSLNTADFIISAVLFWEFSWGLLKISIEVEERISRQQHWLR